MLVPRVVLAVCPYPDLKILLIDKSEETGSFETMRCTQYGALPEFHGRYDTVQRRATSATDAASICAEARAGYRTPAPSIAASGTAPSTGGRGW